MATKKEEKTMQHIRFAKGETGWAERVGDGKYKIMNIPLAQGLNLFDIVTVKESKGWLIVDQILESPLKKVFVHYEKEADGKDIWNALQNAGCHCEGMVPGYIAVACAKDFDIAAALPEHTTYEIQED